jgi:hypothetical protein
VTPLNLDKVGDVAGKTVEGVGNKLEKETKGVTDSMKGLFGK